MDIQIARGFSLVVFLCASSTQHALANAPVVRFDLPAIVPAVDTSVPAVARSAPNGSREVTVQLPLSSLIVDTGRRASSAPPIDHLLVKCSMRDQHPVVSYSPRTELETDYAGPISFTEKTENSDSVGLNLDSTSPPFAHGHLGAEISDKESNSAQFSKQAPMQAVVASGTTNRGRGVYFKFRWTAQQVLEGEKLFQVSFAVPNQWRGGLVDVKVVAKGTGKTLFGDKKLEDVATQHFVVAVHQDDDPKAAEIAMRLANLDQKLASMSQDHTAGSATIGDWLRNTLIPSPARSSHRHQPADWYQRFVVGLADPHTDKQIRKLPMPVRVTVLDYADASRELTQ